MNRVVKSKEASGLKDESPTMGPRAYLTTIYKRLTPTSEKPSTFKNETGSEQEPVKINPESEIQKLIAENPQMSASVFYNLLKSKGFTVQNILPVEDENEAEESVEADSGSSFGASLRDGIKKLESNVLRNGNLTFNSTRFLESLKDNNPASPQSQVVGFTKFKVVLLQEGMGNFGDANYYSKDALVSGISQFEGAKIYADHPSASDEYNRPERTVRDILGHFESVHIEEAEDGRSNLVGEVCIIPEEPFRWARAMMEHAVSFSKKFPDKEFIGLSINANGDASEMNISDLLEKGVPESAKLKLNEALANGIDKIKYVTNITSAVSCDLVTTAGAGGKVLNLLEGVNMSKKTKIKEAEEQDPSKLKAEADVAADAGDKVDHPDAAQDMDLIKKMISKYLTAGDQTSEEECGIVKEAYEACKEMGMKDAEAEGAAINHLKLAKHLAGKQAAAAPVEQEEAVDANAAQAIEAEVESEEAEEKEEEKVKESMIALKAENAKLKESLRKVEVKDFITKILTESKFGKESKDAFRELVKEAKSVEDVTKAWKIFEAATKSVAPKANPMFDDLTVTLTEKATPAVGKASLFDDIKV